MQLDEEIAALRVQQRALVGMLRQDGAAATTSTIDKNMWVAILRAAGLSDNDMARWHQHFERNAPAAHHAFLLWFGIPVEEAEDIRAKSGQT